MAIWKTGLWKKIFSTKISLLLKTPIFFHIQMKLVNGKSKIRCGCHFGTPNQDSINCSINWGHYLHCGLHPIFWYKLYWSYCLPGLFKIEMHDTLHGQVHYITYTNTFTTQGKFYKDLGILLWLFICKCQHDVYRYLFTWTIFSKNSLPGLWTSGSSLNKDKLSVTLWNDFVMKYSSSSISVNCSSTLFLVFCPVFLPVITVKLH